MSNLTVYKFAFFINTVNMTVIFLRTLIIFISLAILMRLMGKRQIGEMQPFEFIVTLIIADLTCIPMADVSIPLIYGLTAVLTLFLLHQILSLVELTGNKAKKIISGKPSIVINKDGVDLKELKKNNLGVDDLIESMRALGYYSLDDLSYAIFESNGKLSPMENKQRENDPTSLPLLIVDDGKTINENLTLIGSDKSKVIDFIKQNGGTLKNTEVLTVDGNGRAYLKQKNKKFNVCQFNLGEGIRW